MKSMKNLFLVGLIALAAVITFAGCATTSSVGGTVDSHGLLSSANAAGSGGEVIASYSVILGLFDSGYENYVTAVKEAEAAGKLVTSVTTDYFGYYKKIQAFAK